MEKDSQLRVNTDTRLSCGFGDWASSGDPLHGGVRRENTRASRKPAEKTVEQVCREDGEVLRGGKQRRILCVCVCVRMCVQERFLRPTCLSLIPKAPFRPRLLAPSPVFMRSNREAPCPHVRREPQLIWPTCRWGRWPSRLRGAAQGQQLCYCKGVDWVLSAPGCASH